MNIDINYINNLLLENNSVKDIRSMLGIGEKAYQREIKALCYKYKKN
ncbi:hypothetical protein [Intestinibacter sp.]